VTLGSKKYFMVSAMPRNISGRKRRNLKVKAKLKAVYGN